MINTSQMIDCQICITAAQTELEMHEVNADLHDN